MYIFLTIISSILTYAFIVKYEKKSFFDKKNIYLFLFSYFVTTTINHLIIYIILGNINLNVTMLSLTPSFIVKYNLMTVVTSLFILVCYFIYKHVHITKNKYNINKRGYLFTNIYYSIIFFMIFAIFFFLQYYSNVPAEQLMFHLQTPLEGTATSIIFNFLLKTLIPTLICVFILYFQIKYFENKKIKIVFAFKKLNITILPIFYCKKKIKLGALITLLVLIIYAFYNYDIFSFVRNQFEESSFIEDEYINPNDVELTFPEEKRNLIYIYLESMETKFSDYTPYLNDISLNNDRFSSNGFYELVGADWTIASMVAQTSGLPLKFSVDSSSYNVNNNSFLNGVVTLGNILEDNGYNNYLYIGSDAAFAGRDLYFSIHGDYEVFDYYSAIEEEYIDDDYYVWWGYEDKKLYEYAKDKLLELADEDGPFNFTLLTVDTHPTDGYLDETCENNYSYQYANVVSCADKMVGEFIEWIQKQDFYDNTTIVISGDHLYMESSSFINSLNASDRYVYNTIINSTQKLSGSIERKYTALDLFPTTLASLGVEIDGNRLGLGVNLYSNEKTIIERYGFDYVNEKLKKKSTFYQDLSLYS